MKVTATQFILPDGRREYHEIVLEDTNAALKVLERRASFEIEQLRSGHWSLEIAILDEDGDPEISEMSLSAPGPLVMTTDMMSSLFNEMTFKLAARL